MKTKAIMIKPVCHHSGQRGDALTETLISMLALVPLFIIIPYIGKYLDVKDKAAAAVRYLTWERTIYSDPEASWDADENFVSDAVLNEQTGVRILGDPREPILTVVSGQAGAFTPNPLWVDYKAENLVTLSGFGITTNNQQPLTTPGSLLFEQSPPINYGPAVETVAFGVGATPGGLFDSLEVNSRSFARASVVIPMKAIPDFSSDGVFVDIEPPDDTTPRIIMPGTGAILTDAWVPGSEDNFVDRTDGLVTDEILGFTVAPGTYTFGNTLLFNEGRKGQNPKLESNTLVLPEKYIDDD